MTKKFMLIVAALFIFVAAESQVVQGNLLASGTVGFNYSKYRDVNDGVTGNESTSTSIWLSPRVGYFISNSIAVGSAINVSLGSTKYDDDDKYNYSSLSLTPFVRYYLPQGIFGQFEIGPGIDTDKWNYANGAEDDKDQYRVLIWSLGAGYSHFLNANVAVEPMLSYISTTYTNKDNTNLKDKYGEILLLIGLSIYLD
jgi:hypothetical protein